MSFIGLSRGFSMKMSITLVEGVKTHILFCEGVRRRHYLYEPLSRGKYDDGTWQSNRMKSGRPQKMGIFFGP